MVTATKGRVVLNLSSVGLSAELAKRMRKNVELDTDLRHVALKRRRGPWLRAAIEKYCESQERERNGEK